jgi:UDP-N-acetylmuramoyl-tripeptide--D-alanyl-D-alanine ligase
MKNFSIGTLARITGAEPPKSTQTCFTGVSTDSRTIKTGDCFFAIPGENFDGHDYVAQALQKGAVCAVVSRDIDPKAVGDKPLLKVADTVRALGDLAREYRRQSGFKVVAITGSVGKTTTRQITHHVLSRHFRVKQSPKSFNNQIGVPLTLLSAEPDDQIVVAELGTNHPGEMAYLTRIALPDMAVVTNVQPAHLEGFGTLDAIAHEKLAIADGLAAGGTLIINGDFDLLVQTCQAKGIGFRTFGKTESCDYRVSGIRFEGLGSSFRLDGAEVQLPLPGPGNVENAAAAWAVCNQFGLTARDFAEALKTLTSPAMRAEIMEIGTLTVLNDCYNANPASMKNALQILRNIEPGTNRRRVFICGEMAELGPQAGQLHAELASSIVDAGVELVLAVGPLARIAGQAAVNAAPKTAHTRKLLRAEFFADAASACENLHDFVRDYDIILVKGSRRVRLEIVVEKLRELFAQRSVPTAR